MPSRSIIILIVSLMLIAIFYTIAFLNAGRWLIKNDSPVNGDAIVLLTGSIADRVLETADRFNEGTAGRIIIVTESMGEYKILEEKGVSLISSTNQICNSLAALGVPSGSITILPGDAESTMEEALVIDKYLTGQNAIDTIILVSSKTHTRRASMIFNHVLRKSGKNVTVLCSPSRYTGFNASRWWMKKEDIQDVVLEYVKLASFVLFEKE